MAEDGLVPIGELARRTGVATSALRYYERIGLLSPAERAGPQRAGDRLLEHGVARVVEHDVRGAPLGAG